MSIYSAHLCEVELRVEDINPNPGSQNEKPIYCGYLLIRIVDQFVKFLQNAYLTTQFSLFMEATQFSNEQMNSPSCEPGALFALLFILHLLTMIYVLQACSSLSEAVCP